MISPPLSKAIYYLRHISNEVKAMIKEMVYKIDINVLRKNEEEKHLK